MPPISQHFIKQLCMIFIISASLMGCGIKPGQPERPASKDGTTYPRTYPNPDLNAHP